MGEVSPPAATAYAAPLSAGAPRNAPKTTTASVTPAAARVPLFAPPRRERHYERQLHSGARVLSRRDELVCRAMPSRRGFPRSSLRCRPGDPPPSPATSIRPCGSSSSNGGDSAAYYPKCFIWVAGSLGVGSHSNPQTPALSLQKTFLESLR